MASLLRHRQGAASSASSIVVDDSRIDRLGNLEVEGPSAGSSVSLLSIHGCMRRRGSPSCRKAIARSATTRSAKRTRSLPSPVNVA
jgi:hypothetical protein